MSVPRPENNRIRRDVLRLMESKFEVNVLESLKDLHVKFAGPPDTPYDGGFWWVRVHLDDDYPFKPPTILFATSIYHPNIDESSGTVCMNVISQTWTALYDLLNIFDTFLPQLLTYPNPDDPINEEAARLLKTNKEQYNKKVLECIRRSAEIDAFQKRLPRNEDAAAAAADDSDSSLSDHNDCEEGTEKCGETS